MQSIFKGFARLAIAATAFAAALAPQGAVAATYAGDTTDTDFFNRPTEDLSDIYEASTDIRYEVLTFTVDTDGSYDFLMEASKSAFGYYDWDAFLLLYAGDFDPTDPLTNALIAHDGYDPSYDPSAFSYDLVAGTTYKAVATGFWIEARGAYTLAITGPGAISADRDALAASGVPEPASWAMLVIGFGLTGAAIRRRRVPLTA